ncbi:MAG: hypothetical protein AMK70_08090, partial [Nitrospira bacterium SG8_35_1]
MAKKISGNQFFIEQLEPRLLFSADSGALPLDALMVDFSDVEASLVPGVSDSRQSVVEQQQRREIIFIDANVPDYQQLVDGLQGTDPARMIEVVVIEADRDGIEQVSKILADRSDLDAVHFITHGADGKIKLGNTWLNSSTLQQNGEAVAGWGEALGQDADLLIYGCDVAATTDGQAFVARLGELTGADVTASTDSTGSDDLGGDWELEYQGGTIEAGLNAEALSAGQWQGLLADNTTLVTQDTGALAWSGNHMSTVFYNGEYYFLIYRSGADNILYKTSADNVSWSGVQTLATDALGSNFDISLVDDYKFDLIYLADFGDVKVLTATISGQTITPGTVSTVGNGWSGVSVTRAPSSDRIWVSGREGAELVVYSADQTGDADGVSSWTGEVTTEDSNVTNYTSLTSYGSADKVLVVYVRDPGGTGSDGFYSREITRGGGAGTSVEIGDLNGFGTQSGVVRVSDTEFHVIVDTVGTTPQEYIWNGTAWSAEATIGSANIDDPALVYDRTNDDFYVIAHDTSTDDIIRYHKPSGGSWDAGTIADGGEADTHLSPIASSVVTPYGSARAASQIVWAYMTDDGSLYDLYVGNLTIGSVEHSLTVNTTSDTADGDTSSIDALLADKGADGVISLREAITAANNTANLDATTPDEINFEIPDALVGGAHTIVVSSGGLPDITDAVIIDGTTDSDFSTTPIIELNGSGAGFLVSGITLESGSDGSTIRGLVINRFSNTGSGIYVTTDNNLIAGNFIGTDVTGTADLGNGAYGITITVLEAASNNTIGGTVVADRNILSGNAWYGVAVSGTGTGNVIIGNYIGTDVTGTLDLGNTIGGVDVSADNNRVGGTAPGEANLIYGNDGYGLIISGGATGVSLLGNTIYGNTDLGIDIDNDGVTANDADDADSGANNSQNFPVITVADLSGTDLTVSGILDTDGLNTQYRIEFFGNADGVQDPTNGEGSVYLGTTTVTTDGSGDASFTDVVLSGVTLSAGDYVTATATKIDDPGQVGVDDSLAYGDTSEFAVNFAIVGADSTAPTQTNNTGSTIVEGGTDTISNTELRYDDSEQPATSVTYTINSGPTNGQFELTTNPGVAVTTWTQAQIDANQVVYVHDGSNTTSDSITFTVDDGQGNALAGQSFSITVTAVDDDAPTQVNNTGSTIAEGGTDTITNTELRYDDSEQPATSVTYTINSGPSNGQFELTTNPGVAVTTWTQAQIDA